jgi:hypothetical protein
MLARTPILIIHRRPWRRVAPVVRAMHGAGAPDWHIAARLAITPAYVARALAADNGIWSPAEWPRLTRAAAEVER